MAVARFVGDDQAVAVAVNGLNIGPVHAQRANQAMTEVEALLIPFEAAERFKAVMKNAH